VKAGFIAGFGGDTPDAIRAIARQLYEVGVDVPFLSILTPYRGTALHAKLEGEGRIWKDSTARRPPLNRASALAARRAD
jgi:radical SAM superfamily enzyme YgiQ (UPF0313 family)